MRYRLRPASTRFYDCDICGAIHPWLWHGDCRDDASRLNPEDIPGVAVTRPWLKITLDHGMAGTALVGKFPRKGTRRTPGRWVVFDKNQGDGPLKDYHSEACMFDAETCEECMAWIRTYDTPTPGKIMSDYLADKEKSP